MILKLVRFENRRSLLKKRVDTLVVAVAEAAWTEFLFRLMNSLTHYFFLRKVKRNFQKGTSKDKGENVDFKNFSIIPFSYLKR